MENIKTAFRTMLQVHFRNLAKVNRSPDIICQATKLPVLLWFFTCFGTWARLQSKFKTAAQHWRKRLLYLFQGYSIEVHQLVGQKRSKNDNSYNFDYNGLVGYRKKSGTYIHSCFHLIGASVGVLDCLCLSKKNQILAQTQSFKRWLQNLSARPPHLTKYIALVE